MRRTFLGCCAWAGKHSAKSKVHRAKPHLTTEPLILIILMAFT
jgi:hypothetical protein